MIEANDGAVRIVSRQERSLRVYQLVQSNDAGCDGCAWKPGNLCHDMKYSIRRAFGDRINRCSYPARGQRNGLTQIVKEI